METISLKTLSMEGKIYVGTDVISTRLPLLTATQNNFVVTDDHVYVLYRKFFDKYFQNAEIYVLSSGEENKNFHSLNAILEKMAGAGMRRSSRLFAVGGGVVGDIGGLAAALYMRGISYVQIPTTLLAQVDSSVGGKTAVDLGGIKNVVGAFYQPCEVLVDPTFLNTLSEREIKCGIGEIVKYAALDSELFDILEQNLGKFSDVTFWKNLISTCIQYKVKVVEIDEKEQGERRCLNVGHTTAHAIELSSVLSHGESVLYGMLLETKMALMAGVCEKKYGERLLKIIHEAISLPPHIKTQSFDIETNAKKTLLDKKNREDHQITMAVAKAKGEWTILTLPFEKYKEMLVSASAND